MPTSKFRNIDDECCPKIENNVTKIIHIDSFAQTPSALEGVDSDIIVMRKSDWAALTGPIVFPGQNAKQGWKI